MAHPIADTFGDFVHIVQLFQQSQGQYKPVAFFQLQFERPRRVHQLAGILQILVVIGLKPFVALQFAVGLRGVGLGRRHGPLPRRVIRRAGLLPRQETRRDSQGQKPQPPAPGAEISGKTAHFAIITFYENN